jgi:drug/metabolite transporter (DMT)-like permease
MGRQGVAFALLLCFLWGGLAPALKVSLRGMAPFAIAGWRFLLALACILLWCRVNQIDWQIPRRMHVSLMAFSVLFALQIGLLNLGAQWTSSNHTVVLLNTNPVFVALLAHFFIPNDRLSWQKAAGLFGAFAGVCVTFLETVRMSGESPWLGDSIVLVSGLVLGVLHVYSKFLVHRLTPFQVVVWQMIYGVPLFFLASAFLETTSTNGLSWTVVASILYQGVAVGAFCFTGWTHLMQRFAASKVATFQFTTPLFGVVLSAWILGESTSATLLAGGGLVALGIYWVARATEG